VVEPPACSRTENGRPVVYESVEARCRACEVYGGIEEKCISDAESERIMAKTGRPCHRVDLSLGNSIPAAIIGWLRHPDLQPLAALMTQQILEPYTPEERALLLARVKFALSDDIVLGILHPAPK